jgi:two-component system response regulator
MADTVTEDSDSTEERRSKPTEIDILLVEDNPADIELCLHSFRRRGLANRVRVARDGAEALEILLNEDPAAPRPPRLLLLDLHLPMMDGLEVLEKVRADPRTRTVPVVLLTSSDAETDRLKAYVSGANSYLVKPVDARSFEVLVDELSLYWLKFNRPDTERDNKAQPRT